jgi:hypothetical protein
VSFGSIKARVGLAQFYGLTNCAIVVGAAVPTCIKPEPYGITAHIALLLLKSIFGPPRENAARKTAQLDRVLLLL